ncbi:beta-propeller fold lactonase family protein [Robbsia sp. Bb-Pol-6]|uniref:Beta-propeller fold lactonase family protein n=1 Tax=Robbsia betulipollinis TaxID=2981849 RepID=A0ABT3ZPG0_9BURK|nr:beta-propeller fold lactonase family protein [Robbsia betulipollinis]MCY0388439.1 beta-propeller fold lactonase family protein [Robbsia betulipollinis]
MPLSFRVSRLSLVTLLALGCATSPLVHAEATAPAAQTAASVNTARWTFDGAIHNNSLALSPDETLAVVSYSQRPDIIVYDVRAKRVKAVLHGYVTPRNIVFSPSGDRIYISDSSLGTVTIIDAKNLKTIRTLPVGPGAFGTILSKDGKSLYINNEAASTVTRYDTGAFQPEAVITGFAQPRQGVRLSPDNGTLYVTNFLGDKITIVNTQTNKIDGEITGFKMLRAISVTADGTTLFAANSGTNSIAVVDIQNRKITNTIPVGKDPYGAALSPDGKFIYVGNLGDNSVSVVSVATQKVEATITGLKEPRQATVFTHDNRYAYVLNEDLSIVKIDRDNNSIVETLSPPTELKS